MLLLALRGLVGARRRLVATGAAVALGVALAAGALVLGRAIDASLEASAAAPARAADVVVRQQVALRSTLGPVRARLPGSVVDLVRDTPGVGAAAGVVQGYAQPLDAAGTPLAGPSTNPSRLGLPWLDQAALNPWHLVAGTAPTAADEVVIDAGTARRAHLQVGQSLDVSLTSGRVPYRLVGVAALAGRDAPAASTVVLFDPAEAAHRLGSGDQVDMVLADTEVGGSATALAERLRAALPTDVEVLTAPELDRAEQAELDRTMVWLRAVLAAFVSVALAAAGLLIANTFSVLVAQRARELALLRALGAHRRQVTLLALGEAAGVGLAGSVVGVGLGLALARVLAGALAAAGWDDTGWSLGLDLTAVVIPVVLGLVVTLAGAARPAWRAGRLAPVAAVREMSAEAPAVAPARVAAGSLSLSVGIALLVSAGEGGGRVSLLVAGAAAALAGLALAGPVLVAPVLRVAGLSPVAWVLLVAGAVVLLAAAAVSLASVVDGFVPGVVVAVALAAGGGGLVVAGRAGRGPTAAVARRNLHRQPRRTAATVGSLVVGVGVAATLLVLASSIRSGIGTAVERTFRGDFVVTGGSGAALGAGSGGLDPQLAVDLAAVPGVAVASGVRVAQVEVDGHPQAVPAVDADVLAPVFDVGLVAGSVADLGRDALAVHVDRARREGWQVGDTITVTFPTTGPQPFTISALYDQGDLVGDVLLDIAALDARQAAGTDLQVFVGLERGASADQMRAPLTDVVARYPSARLLEPDQYRHEQEGRIDDALALALALVALAVVIAVLGVANTLALSTVERRRELALLRAVGASAAQVRALLRWEAATVSLVGAAGGCALGVVLAWATLRAVGAGGYRQLAVPGLQLAALVALTTVAGVLAATLPARRAGRVDVVQALAED